MALLDFHSNSKIIFSVHLKHLSFLPLTGIKSMSNGLADAMPSQCTTAHSMSIKQSLCFCTALTALGFVYLSVFAFFIVKTNLASCGQCLKTFFCP